MSEIFRLNQIAHGRSGDKGNHANIGLIAYTPQGYAFLEQHLRADVVRNYFARLGPSKVERFELPGIGAFNFLLHNVLESDSLLRPTTMMVGCPTVCGQVCRVLGGK